MPDDHTLAAAIDTNFPDEDGRIVGNADDAVIITIRFDDAPFDVSAVPVPDTCALKLSGLALIDAAVRRRCG